MILPVQGEGILEFFVCSHTVSSKELEQVIKKNNNKKVDGGKMKFILICVLKK